MKKIIITGAHHNSALAVASDLRKKGFSVFWLGHKYTMRGDKEVSAEYREVTASGIEFIELKAGKINPRPELINIAKIPMGFTASASIIKRVKPDAILSFGGYLSVPVVVVAKFFGIPIFIHEQTSIAGRANIFAARFAKKIFLTWESSQAFFPASKCEVTGLPLNPHLLSAKPERSSKLPTILIMGGKQGSHSINAVVFELLPTLLKHYNLIHLTGSSSLTGDYQKALDLKKALPSDIASHYHPYDYLVSDKIAPALKTADLVISRAGAHTVYELAFLHKPAILVPYPYAPQNEQGRNAKILAESGLAEVLPEARLSPDSLSEIIASVFDRPRTAADKITVPADATEKIVAAISQEVS